MILCSGEALIDMLPRVSATNEQMFAPHAGGAVFNTAMALGRLGRDTGFFSGLSSDLFGEILQAALKDSGVDTSLANISDRPTTLAFVKLVDGHASYAFYDENTAGRCLGLSDVPTLPPSVKALFFGGISLVVEPCAEAYEALMAREAASRVTMIDPNIRPSFISDEAAYRARLERMIALSNIVKLSDEDLHWLLGDGALPDLAQRILDMGPKVFCLTEGAKGVTAYTKDGAYFEAAQKVEVVDTVGAGDTFNAGFLAALDCKDLLDKAAFESISEEDLRAALKFGAKVAAIVVARAGANPPWAHELT